MESNKVRLVVDLSFSGKVNDETQLGEIGENVAEALADWVGYRWLVPENAEAYTIKIEVFKPLLPIDGVVLLATEVIE